MTDWEKLDAVSKTCDLIRNGTGTLESICRQMEKNRKQDPVPFLRELAHRLYGLAEGVAIIEEYEIAKNKK